MLYNWKISGCVTQLGEYFPCTEKVGGSNPLASTTYRNPDMPTSGMKNKLRMIGRPPNPIDEFWLKGAYLKGLIPKTKFKDGTYYYGKCRNGSVAKWDSTLNKFLYVRTKFGHKFVDRVEAVEDDIGYDLFIPVAEIEPTDEERV